MIERDLTHLMGDILQKALPMLGQLLIQVRCQLSEEQSDHTLKQILTPVHVPVKRHRLHTQLLSERTHREPLRTRAINLAKSSLDNEFAAQAAGR